jgi:hypothetical protein
VRVWCGVVHIAYCMSYHTHTRAATNGGYSGGWNCDVSKKGHGRELTRGAVDSVALARSVCVYRFHGPRFLREQFQGEYGQVPWRPEAAGVANADGPGCACLLSCPCSDTLCVSRRRSELPQRQRAFVGRTGNKFVKQVDDVHIGGI